MFRFWEAVQILKTLPQSQVQEKVNEIWGEFLASDASCPINVDSKSYEITKKNMENPDRWSFDCASVCFRRVMHKCLFKWMKTSRNCDFSLCLLLFSM